MMNRDQISDVMQEAIFTILICSAPMLIAALTVGLVISIFQATTQINEQTLSFVPKVVAIFLTIIIFGGFILTNVGEFINYLFGKIAEFT